MLRETSTADAPWTVVEGEDDRYRNITVGKVLLDAMTRIIPQQTRHRRARAIGAGPPPSVVDNVRLVRELDLTRKVAGRGLPGGASEVAGTPRGADGTKTAFAITR